MTARTVIRKVQPFDEACAHIEIWASGARRDDGETRERMPRVTWDDHRGVIQIAPIAECADVDVDTYLTDHGLPRHPLKADGYGSIGCHPCTLPVERGQHPHSGRWSGTDKRECGLNLLPSSGAQSH